MWATHTQYLNDDSEFRHALALTQQSINVRKAAVVNGEEASKTWQEMYRTTEGIESINVCVSSFSEVPDSLSQWRAYSGPTSGFAIGVSGKSLRNLVLKHSFYLAPCIYEEPQQQKLIDVVVDGVFRENMDAKLRIREEGEKEEDELFLVERGGNLPPRLHRYAPIIKHHKFSEEKEWRIITRPVMVSNSKFDFREGKSTIVPFYKIDLDYEGVSAKIVEVVVGPTPRPLHAQSAVARLLRANGLKEVQVKPTEIPYRNW